MQKWDLTSLKIKAPFLEMEWEPRDEDKDAAWELYVKLITRVSTQHLEPEDGDEAAWPAPFEPVQLLWERVAT